MTEKYKLWYLINGVLNGSYDIEIFCSEFTRIYNLETDYDNLSEQENSEFKDLSDMTARFSNNKNELEIPNMYYSQKDILKKIKKVKLRLCGKL